MVVLITYLMTVFGLEHVTGHPEDLFLLVVLIPHHHHQIRAHITNVRHQLYGVFHQQLLHVTVVYE